MRRLAPDAEASAATASKLEKRRLLAEHLASLPESDLFWAIADVRRLYEQYHVGYHRGEEQDEVEASTEARM